MSRFEACVEQIVVCCWPFATYCSAVRPWSLSGSSRSKMTQMYGPAVRSKKILKSWW
jgi:hypothetical protein